VKHRLDDTENVPEDWMSWALYRNGEWTAHVRIDPPKPTTPAPTRRLRGDRGQTTHHPRSKLTRKK
jgi:hypothetical protein